MLTRPQLKNDKRYSLNIFIIMAPSYLEDRLYYDNDRKFESVLGLVLRIIL